MPMQDRQWVLLVLGMAIGITAFSWANYPAVLPFILEDLVLSGTGGGILYSAYFAGYLLVIIPAGYLVDRYNARRIIGIASIGTGVFGMAFAYLTIDLLSGSLWRLAAGACFAGVYVPGMRMLSDWFPAQQRGRAIGLYVGALTVGSGIAYPLSTWLASTVDWRFAIAATSAPAVIAGAGVLALGRDHPSENERSVSFDPAILTDRSYVYTVTAYASHNWELFGVKNWIVAFLVVTPAVAATDSPAVTAGILAGVLTVVGGPGNAIGGWLSDRIGRISAAGGALAISGTLTLILGLHVWESLLVLGTVVVLYGLVLAADSAPLSTAITELVDDEHVGTALAGQSLIGFIPGIISPIVFGVALDLIGFSVGFITLAFGAAVGLISLALLRKHVRSTANVEGVNRTAQQK